MNRAALRERSGGRCECDGICGRRHTGRCENIDGQLGDSSRWPVRLRIHNGKEEGLSRFWMQFTSSVCKRVQVGTKTVEQPIYEVQCGALPDLIEEAPAAANLTVVDGGFDDIPF